MNKHFIGRASLIGDTIMSLPLLNIVDGLDPGSYKIFPISKKTSQSAPLFLNHPMIDRIYIMDEWESLSQTDLNVINSCVVKVNPFPQHPPCPGLTVGIDNFWYNEYDCVEETARMAGFSLDLLKQLPEEQQRPKLYKWFKYDQHTNTIGIWAYAGYGVEPKRNPTPQWWDDLVSILIKDYNIFQFGAEKDPPFNSIISELGGKYRRFNECDFLQQVKLAAGCRLNINTDSGSGWIIGAYGDPQISLITNHCLGHTKNLLALAPKNYSQNNIDLLGEGSCDNIAKEKVLENIRCF